VPPLGVTYTRPKASLDAFFEVVPMLDIAPETAFDLNAAIGVRFFFNGAIDRPFLFPELDRQYLFLCT